MKCSVPPSSNSLGPARRASLPDEARERTRALDTTLTVPRRPMGLQRGPTALGDFPENRQPPAPDRFGLRVEGRPMVAERREPPLEEELRLAERRPELVEPGGALVVPGEERPGHPVRVPRLEEF